jgi:hypothetical protein
VLKLIEMIPLRIGWPNEIAADKRELTLPMLEPVQVFQSEQQHVR